MSAEALDELTHIAARLLERVAELKAAPASTLQLVTLERAAEMLAVSRTTMQEMIDAGEIPVVPVTPRAVRVDVRDIEARIRALRHRRG